jgi:hypothetical protein
MPTRNEIKPLVIEKIQAVTEEDDLAKNESSILWDDLGMGPTVKKAMGLPYSKISQKYPGGLAVSMTAAGECKTVGDSIDLVFNRSNGQTK